jgi:hypothetical protein
MLTSFIKELTGVRTGKGFLISQEHDTHLTDAAYTSERYSDISVQHLDTPLRAFVLGYERHPQGFEHESRRRWMTIV